MAVPKPQKAGPISQLVLQKRIITEQLHKTAEHVPTKARPDSDQPIVQHMLSRATTLIPSLVNSGEAHTRVSRKNITQQDIFDGATPEQVQQAILELNNVWHPIARVEVSFNNSKQIAIIRITAH